MARGQITEFILPLLFIVVLITLVVGLHIGYTAVQDTFTAENEVAGELIGDALTMFEGFDNAVVFIVLALWASTLIAAIFVDSHPVYFIVSVIFFIFATVGAAVISNVWNAIYTAEGLAETTTTYFTNTNLLMTNAPLLVAVGILLWSIDFYAKRRMVV